MENFVKLPHDIYQDAVNKIAELHNLNDKSKYEIKVSAGSVKGDNYIGVIFRIQIKCKIDNSIKMSLIAKLSPQSAARREECKVDFAFHREIQFYEVLFPIYKQFQQKRGVNVECEGFFEAPYVHLTLKNEPHEAIFFEDLNERNFEMFDRMKDFTKDHVILVMKALAKMHAVFFCIKDQEPEKVKSFLGMEDFMMYLTRIGKNLLKSWYESQKVHAFAALAKIKNADAVEKISGFLNQDMCEMLQEMIGINVAEPYSTICHGDVWCNNMMFRYDDNGVPVEVSLLDFQILRYSSPVIDVLYHIFTSTTKELRKKHYQEFLDTYYNTLREFILRLNSNPEKIFPRHIFNNHLIRFGKFGLYMAILVLPAITSKKENIPDIESIAENLSQSTNGENKTIDFQPSERYEERIIGVFEDIYDSGYL